MGKVGKEHDEGELLLLLPVGIHEEHITSQITKQSIAHSAPAFLEAIPHP